MKDPKSNFKCSFCSSAVFGTPAHANTTLHYGTQSCTQDYGDGIDPKSNSKCAAFELAACPAGCCYSPTWQVRRR